MKYILILLVIIGSSNHVNGQFHASEINFEYNKDSNRIYLELRYWRICNKISDRMVQNIKVEIPGCNDFEVGIDKTTITDVSLHKARYPNQACVIANSNNNVKGVEEFRGTASFALDTLPFKNAIQNGCTDIYFSAQIGNLRPNSTTGVNGFHYNYAQLNLAAIEAAQLMVYESPRFMQAHHSENLNCNSSIFLDFGLDHNNNDDINCEMAPALNNSRTSTLLPSSPFTYKYPLNVYCLPGSSIPCQNIPQADPPTGFYVDPFTGGMAFTPTNCSQTSAAVVNCKGLVKDTNGNNILASTIRRDFTILVGSFKKNNNPKLLGPYSWNSTFGKNIDIDIRSKDDPVILPPPNIPQTPDTTFFIVKTSHPSIQVSVKDSNVRERMLNVKIITDSAAAAQKVLTLSVIAYDQDSLYHGRTSRSYRFYIPQKLKVELQTTKLTCGNIKISLEGDSADLSKAKSLNPKITLTNSQGWTETIFLSQDSVLFALPDTGTFYLRAENTTPSRDLTLQSLDTIHYNQHLVRVQEDGTDYQLCSDSVVIENDYFVRGNSSFSTLWSTNNIPLGLSEEYVAFSAGDYLFKVFSASCEDSTYVKVRDFDEGNSKITYLNLCSNNCDTLIPNQYARSLNSISSRTAYLVNNGTPISIDLNSWSTCNSQGGKLSKTMDTIVIFSKIKTEQCNYKDTLFISYTTLHLKFLDSIICPNRTPLNLKAVASPNQLYNPLASSFRLLDTSLVNPIFSNSSNGVYSIDLKVPADNYPIEASTIKDQCIFKDTFNINLKSNAYLGNFEPNHSFCEQKAPFLFSHITSDPAFIFELEQWNNQPFTGDTNLFISNLALLKTDTAAIYLLSAQKKLANGCATDTAVNITVLPNPIFDLGPDLQLNRTKKIILNAPVGMSSYQWSIAGQNGRSVEGYPEDLGLKNGANIIECTIVDSNGCIAKDNVLIDYFTSIKSVGTSVINIYPNPSNGQIHIESPEPIERIQLFSLEGKLLEQKYFKGGRLKMDYNLSNYSAASYILGIQANNQWIFQSIQIEK